MKKLLNFIFTFLLVLIAGSVFYFNGPRGTFSAVESFFSQYTRAFPALENPKEIGLSCDYQGSSISVTQKMYGSVNEYYKTEPEKKKDYYKQNDKDFVFSYQEDNTIKEITEKIVIVGKQNKLSQDQILDLAACMVQNIPYDSSKAAKILSPSFKSYPVNEVIPRYPYETLYENSGLCTDKTFLGAAIIKELGYKTGILTFEKEKHMSLGIGVPNGYASLSSGYGIMELTNLGFKVGDIPEVDAQIGSTTSTISAQEELETNGNSKTESAKKTLSAPSSTASVSNGLEYTRILERISLKQELDATYNSLLAKKKEVESAEQQYVAQKNLIEPLSSKCNAENTAEACTEYNAAVPAYNKAVNNYNKKVTEYNELVKKYNSLVLEYQSF